MERKVAYEKGGGMSVKGVDHHERENIRIRGTLTFQQATTSRFFHGIGAGASSMVFTRADINSSGLSSICNVARISD